MKLLALLLCSLTAALAAPGELGEVRNVYLLRMGNGFEQFLANHLTNDGMMRVVTDPKAADAVFTDVLGEQLDLALKELYETSPPPLAQGSAGAEAKDDAPAARKEGAETATKRSATAAEAAAAEPSRRSTFGSKGRGNVFLVNPRTKAVIWSTYSPPKDGRAESLDKAARSVVKRLRQSAAGQ